MTNNLLFQQLHAELTDRPFLKQNPVFGQSDRLGEVLQQYVRFPEEIVNMLKGAAAHFPADHPIHQELERNWGQENGSATGGVPHVEILKHALKRDLSLNADDMIGSSATEEFISTVLDGMKQSAWFAVGQAYALEASAVPELAILVGPAINACAKQTGVAEPINQKALLEKNANYSPPNLRTREEAYAMSMSDWFALHIIDFEVGHRDFLREKISIALTDDTDQEEFARGFRCVLDAMDRWWLRLSRGE